MQIYYFETSEEEEEQGEAFEEQRERVLECTYRYRRGEGRAIAARLYDETSGDIINVVEYEAYKDSDGYYRSKGYVGRRFNTYEEALYFLKDWAYQ